GTVLVDAMAMGGLGTTAFVAGPGGESAGFWQADTFKGHDPPLTPGTSVWSELMSTRSDAAVEFYRAVAGWEPTRMGDDAQGDGGRCPGPSLG
ncbi:VOC family protein, partial [Streptomyces sp. NPDC051172]